MNLEKVIKKGIKKVKNFLNTKKSNTPNVFEGSEKYWEQRYKAKRNSGPGSYGRLAVFKAEVLNDFVKVNAIKTVVEFGCGDGNQLLLAEYPSYKGYDVSKKAISLCKKTFKKDRYKRFKLYKKHRIEDTHEVDLVLSLDVIYHLVEDAVFNEYMERLFLTSNKYVIIYSSNYNDHSADHVKSRKFTDWIDTNIKSEWILKDFIKNKYPPQNEDLKNTSMADFYIYEKNTTN